MSTRGRPFYGWVIVFAVFVQLTFAAGLTFYGLPLYLKKLTETRGFSVTEVSLATSTFWIASGLTGLLVARWLARFDPRYFIVVGALIGGASMVLIGRVTQLWQLFLVYITYGAAFTCVAVLVANTVITRWFHRRRSVALSLATTGLSFGGIALTPIAANLLKHHPIDSAMTQLAVTFALGVSIIPVLLLRPDPSLMGLGPDGDQAHELVAGQAAPITPGISFQQATGSVIFAAITAAFTLGLLGQVGGITQLVKLATERAGEATSARVVSVLALCSVIGRLSGGAIVTKFSTNLFALGALGMQMLGLTFLAFASSPAAIFIGASIFGLGIGNVLLLHPLLLAEVFGVRDYAKIYGRSALFVAGGNAVGPLAMGWLRDHGGGYRTSYIVAAVLNMIGLAIFIRWGTTKPDVARRNVAGLVKATPS
jgi:MFS family permease